MGEMQSTNDKYGTPYMAAHSFTLPLVLLVGVACEVHQKLNKHLYMEDSDNNWFYVLLKINLLKNNFNDILVPVSATSRICTHSLLILCCF